MPCCQTAISHPCSNTSLWTNLKIFSKEYPYNHFIFSEMLISPTTHWEGQHSSVQNSLNHQTSEHIIFYVSDCFYVKSCWSSDNIFINSAHYFECLVHTKYQMEISNKSWVKNQTDEDFLVPLYVLESNHDHVYAHWSSLNFF
jgi:hypothetical protein